MNNKLAVLFAFFALCFSSSSQAQDVNIQESKDSYVAESKIMQEKVPESYSKIELLYLLPSTGDEVDPSDQVCNRYRSIREQIRSEIQQGIVPPDVLSRSISLEEQICLEREQNAAQLANELAREVSDCNSNYQALTFSYNQYQSDVENCLEAERSCRNATNTYRTCEDSVARSLLGFLDNCDDEWNQRIRSCNAFRDYTQGTRDCSTLKYQMPHATNYNQVCLAVGYMNSHCSAIMSNYEMWSSAAALCH